MTRDGVFTRFFDEVLDFAKRFEKRYHAAAYADLAESARRRLLSEVTSPRLEKPMEQGDTALSPQSILIFKPDEIGDAVLALPALIALRRSHPKAWIGMVCQQKTVPIYESSGLFNEVIPLRVKMRFRRFPSFDEKALRARLPQGGVEVGVFLRNYPSYFSSFKKLPMQTAVFPQDPRLQWVRPSTLTPSVSTWQKERPHQILQMWETLAPLLVGRERILPRDPLEASFPIFKFKPEDRVEVPEQYLVAHPFNDLETKRYPLDWWQTILARAHQLTGLPILVIGSPADPEFPETPGVQSLRGQLSLGQSGYVLSRATALLGTSSGPAHWAAAMNVPTLGLMSGHTSPEEWRFVKQGVALRVEVDCSPCHLRTCNREKLKCLTQLTPERVLPHVESFLSRAQQSSNIVNQDLSVLP